MPAVESHPKDRLFECRLRPVTVVSPDTSLAAVAEKLVEDNLSCVLVGTAGELCSIMTERDLARAWGRGFNAHDPVRLVAVPCPLTVPADATMFDAAVLMLRYGIRHLVVTDDSRALGVLSIRDALAALVGEHSSHELAAEAIHWALAEQPEAWWG
jgi:CBS domain-containing protein